MDQKGHHGEHEPDGTGKAGVEDLLAYRELMDDMTVQLIEGELIVSPSPSVQHQVCLAGLFRVLDRGVPEDHRVLFAPMDLRL